MRRFPLVAAALAAPLLLANAAAPGGEPPGSARALDRLDGFVEGVAAAGQFSGVVLVAVDGTVRFEKAYGERDEAREGPLITGTRFDIASAGKMFAVTAILQQVAQGRLALDTRLGEVIEDYPNEAMRAVTVRQLLTHTAGAGDADAMFYPGLLAWQGRTPAVAEIVALYGGRAPAHVPGAEQVYGNHAMMLLGRMVELLSGESYRHYVAARIFEPAGMDAAHADAPCDPADAGQAVGYALRGEERVPNCFMVLDGGWPAGGQSFTARDMLRFVEALRSGRLGVPRPLFEEAIRPRRNGFGLGFFATDYGEGWLPRDLRWGHGGKLDGQCVDVRRYEATGETIVVLGNNDSPACYAIAGFLHRDWRTRAE